VFGPRNYRAAFAVTIAGFGVAVVVGGLSSGYSFGAHESADESLRRADVEARRALSSLMTSLKTQQMALQVACDNVLLAATNAQRLAAGDWPHGYPGSGVSEKNVTHLGRKVASAGEDLLGIVATFGAFENELTLARRAYEVAISGQTRRSQCFEAAYAEILRLADGDNP
jgi:hypothetical protein